MLFISVIFLFKGGNVIKNFRKNNAPKELVNEAIPNVKLRLIDENGENKGIVEKDEAIEYAKSINLDVVVVSDNKEPYTAKVMDYAKFRFDQQKKLKEIKKKQQTFQVKEVKIGPTIQENDLQTKLKNAIKFLEKGDKVKVSMFFRGRMINNIDVGLKVFKKFLAQLEDIAVLETKLSQDRSLIYAILAPKAKKK